MQTLKLHIRYWLIRVFVIILFALFIWGCYFFHVQRFSWGIFNIRNNYYATIEHLPFWLYIVEYLVFVFFAVSILLLVLTILYKRNKRIGAALEYKYDERFATLLGKYLYVDLEHISDEQRQEILTLKNELRNAYAKRIFINTLRRIRTQTVGAVRERTQVIYDYFQFDLFIRTYLFSPHLSKKIFALKVIADFQVKGYDNYIVKLTKLNNDMLHSEALVTLLKLDKFDSLMLLDYSKMKLTVWDINIIIKTIQEIDSVNINYAKLVKSEKNEVVVLGLMLARLRQCVELKVDAQQLIGNKNDLINEEAFFTYISFVETEADYDFLIQNFNLATEKAKVSILKIMERHPNRLAAIDFLEQTVENNSFILRLEAVQVLFDLDINTVMRLKNSEDKVITDICHQVLDLNL